MKSVRFYVPPTLVQDFDEVLTTDIAKEVVVNFNPEKKERIIFYKVKNRSKFDNSDNNSWIRFSLSSDLKKGDYISDENYHYLITWTPYGKDLNSMEAQIQICNVNFTFQRWQGQQINHEGKVITPAGYFDIASDLWCVAWRLGYYDYKPKSGGVGIVPTNSIQIITQYNKTSQQIQISDTFYWKNIHYQVVDVEYTQLNPDGQTGLLVLYASKKVGEQNVVV